jgi:hypothetical protein
MGAEGYGLKDGIMMGIRQRFTQSGDNSSFSPRRIFSMSQAAQSLKALNQPFKPHFLPLGETWYIFSSGEG